MAETFYECLDRHYKALSWLNENKEVRADPVTYPRVVRKVQEARTLADCQSIRTIDAAAYTKQEPLTESKKATFWRIVKGYDYFTDPPFPFVDSVGCLRSQNRVIQCGDLRGLCDPEEGYCFGLCDKNGDCKL